ncbi:MAG: 30S ribosomal protein S8e [Conexivisphaerales archaeon]
MTRPLENLAKRKASGGTIIPYRGRRKFEYDGFALETIQGTQTVLTRRVRGGNLKVGLVKAEFANVVNPQDKTTKKVRILRVISNRANRDYERRGVITKGAIIETELGMARVTSRPSQHGVVNAILQPKK